VPYRRTEDSDRDANADAWIAWAFHVDHVVTVAAEQQPTVRAIATRWY
jgi:hypothetical protein